MWGKKNYCWVWTAVDRKGKCYINFVVGNRGTETGLKLWEKIKKIPVKTYKTDHWKSYAEFVPKEKHVQSKAQTYTVESCNSRIRHYLARFRRKTKCYTKKIVHDGIQFEVANVKIKRRIARV